LIFNYSYKSSFTASSG